MEELLAKLEMLCRTIRYGIAPEHAEVIEELLSLGVYRHGDEIPQQLVLEAIQRGLARPKQFDGWDCDESPTGKCEYVEDDDDLDAWENCTHCGQPEERK